MELSKCCVCMDTGRLNGMPDGTVKAEDDFVVRKGMRVYLKDSEKKKRAPRLLMYDRGEN